MANVEKLSISLTPELGAVIRQAVAAGDYASESEVIREALRDWKQRRALREAGLDQLRHLWDEGLTSGPGEDGATAFARLRRRLTSSERD